MAVIKIEQFSGEIPRAHPSRLPDGAASYAENCDFRDGTLTGIPANEQTSFTFMAGTKDVFFWDANNRYAYAEDVFPVRAPGIDLTIPRWYHTSDASYAPHVVRRNDIQNPNDPLYVGGSYTDDLVGVPAPTKAPEYAADNMSPFGDQIAQALGFFANERQNGVLTDKTRISAWNAECVLSGNTIVEQYVPEKSVKTPSSQYDLFTAPASFVRVEAGTTPTPDVLRNYGALVINGIHQANNLTQGAYGTGAYRYKSALVEAAIEGQTGVDENSVPTYGIISSQVSYPLYLADSSQSAYIKVPESDSGYPETIQGVRLPAPIQGMPYPLNGAMQQSTNGFTFTRCKSRPGEPEKSRWYYITMLDPAYTGITSVAGVSRAEAFEEAKYTPVMANSAESSASDKSAGVVMVVDYWLAQADDDGSITGVAGTYINDRYMASLSPDRAEQVSAKLKKVTAVIREDSSLNTWPAELPKLITTFKWLGRTTDSAGKEVLAKSTEAAYRNYSIMLSAPFSSLEARAYVYTYVNEFGEEGPPSPPLELDSVTDTGRVSLKVYMTSWEPYRYAPCPKIRLYRTATGSSTTQYLFVDEYDPYDYRAQWVVMTPYPGGADVLTSDLLTQRLHFNDTLPNVKAPIDIPVTLTDSKTKDMLGEPLSTQDYYPPPLPLEYATARGNVSYDVQWPLRGLCSINNGMLAAFERNNVWFSFPYLPYAWSAIQKPFPDEVMGICPLENGLFVTTRTYPYILTGMSPDTITDMRVPSLHAGVSKWSIASFGGGVVFASTEGIVFAQGLNASTDISNTLFSKNEWRKMWDGMFGNMRVAVQDNMILIYSYKMSGANVASHLALLMRVENNKMDLVHYSSGNGTPVMGNFTNPFEDDMYVVQGAVNSSNQPVKFSTSLTNRTPFVYQSKQFDIPTPVTMGVVQVEGDGTADITVYSGFDSVSDDELLSHVVATFTAVQVDGKTTLRLPDSDKSRRWMVRVAGTANTQIFKIVLASSMSELKSA